MRRENNEVGNQVHSDYHPVIIKLREGKKKGKSKRGGRDKRTGIKEEMR